MGEFTQNLLKLTEFPFSYSFIGLLALVFGQGINLEELSFTKLGPLLILMGFVATTLSICDPVGAIQRWIIKGRTLRLSIKDDMALDLLSKKVFGEIIGRYFKLPYILAILYSPEYIRSHYDIPWDSINPPLRLKDGRLHWGSPSMAEELDKIGEDGMIEIFILLDRLREQTVKTKWITVEVDKITALIYFIITISTFIAAILLIPDFLTKFADAFGNIEPTKIFILIFSVGALVAVIVMLLRRIYGTDGLRAKSSVVYRYLIALGAVKMNKKDFKPTLDEIERYLNEGHWTLVQYWVDRLQTDYSELFLKEIEKEER